LAVTEKRKVFKAWTVLLAITAFSLSLLGTFLVRSGILVSVHSFASDPTRGLFILAILGLVVGGSLLLFALRAGQLKSVARYSLFSREVLLAGNNVLLSAAALVVLLGTLLPLVHKEMGLGSISIGAPFFNQMFTYLIVPFVLLLGIGPLSRWKQQSARALQKQLLIAFGLSLSAALLLNASFAESHYMATLGMVLSFWILITTIMEVMQRCEGDGKSEKTTAAKLAALTRSHWGMVLGHVGFAVSIIGITLVSHYNQERDVRMAIGDSLELSGYEFRFSGVEALTGPNYTGHVGLVDVYQNGTLVSHLEAEKRFYPVQRSAMTEAGIDSGISRDLFVALGEQLKNGEWALRIYVKPFVNWIWAGAFIMAIGGLLSISDRRYRMTRVAVRKKASSPAPASNKTVEQV
jgi:cytochrome c-type biogenesis protein CcmF